MFAFFGGLLVLLLVAALAAPFFVNFDDYRAQFEAEASRIMGQPVHVDGDLSATLIPFPALTLNDIRIGADEAPIMRAKSLSLDAELAPFLSGEVKIFDARL
ncbi:MAG: AsmA family protein, partial [Pseudomonadota bacterium]